MLLSYQNFMKLSLVSFSIFLQYIIIYVSIDLPQIIKDRFSFINKALINIWGCAEMHINK